MLSARLALAGPVIGSLRMRKSVEEIEALRQAGAAIDAVHAQVPQWLTAGRTERGWPQTSNGPSSRPDTPAWTS